MRACGSSPARARANKGCTLMRARRRTTILPAMTLAQAIDPTRVHRVTGRTGARTAVVTTRPCRAPPHTVAEVGLIAGGQVPLRGGAGPPWGALSGCTPGVPPPWDRGPTSAARRGNRDNRSRVVGCLVSNPSDPPCIPLKVKRSLFTTLPAPRGRSSAARLRRQMEGKIESLPTGKACLD
jgi:hypothetical protein